MPRCRATSPESSWLARPENSMRCQRPGRNVLGDGRAGRRLRPITDGEGRNQHGIRSDEGAVTHDGAVLVLAVVVDEHRAGADVDVLADLGVADVGEVRHLAATPDAGLL